MADISTRMSVSGLSEYKNAMNQAAQSVKTLDAQLKHADAEFKATGDKEKYMADKAKILEERLKAQKNAAKNAQEAMKLLSQNGDTTSTAYQKMAQRLAEAETGILDTTAAINDLQQGEQQAAKGADQLTASVQGLNKKVSLDQVISGVNKITEGLENAAKRALEFGKAFFDELMARAEEADDIATKAMMYDMTPERYQAMKKVADTWGETSVEAIMKARQRVQGKMGDIMDDLMAIGVDPYKNKKRVLGTKDQYTGELKDWEDVFWEAGDALLHLSDGYEKTSKAEAIFGRRWEELRPMFQMGREAYEALVDSQTTNSEKAIQNMATMNDTINQLKADFKILETEVLSGLAPALTDAANVLDSLLAQLMDYLKTEEGQAMLDKLGDSVAGLFEDLANIDPEDVVNNFVTVFSNLVSSFEWVSKNWSEVEGGLKAIVGVWAGGKVLSGALTLTKLFDGIKGLFGIGGATAAAKAGAEAGAAYGAAFLNAFVAAAPILAASMGIVAVATAPALIAQEEAYKKSKEKLDARMKAAEEMEKQNAADAMFVREAAEATVLERSGAVGTKNKDFQAMDDLLMSLKYRQNQQKAELATLLRQAPPTNGYNTWNLLNEYWNGAELDPNMVDALLQNVTDALAGLNKKAEVPVEPKVDAEANDSVAQQIGPVTVPVIPVVTGGGGGGSSSSGGSSSGGGRGFVTWDPGPAGMMLKGRIFANGLPFVPWDGFIAKLHKGERIMPAAENRNYTANSNLYIENMNMSGGMDAQALAAAMSAQNKRISAGFGS